MGILPHIFLRNPNHGTFVYKKGEVNKNIYIVVEGAVEIVTDYDQKAELE